jgi:hypothetical protein
MVYLEFLRVRRRVVVLLAIVAALLALVVVSAGHANLDVNGQQQHVGNIPLAAIIIGAGFVAGAFANFLGASLNSFSDTLPNLWTKPVRREEMALRVIAVDLGAILVVWAGTLALALCAIAALRVYGHLQSDAMVPAAIWLGLGTAFMTYGNAQALTAWHQGKGGMVAGIAGGTYFVLIILAAAIPPTQLLHAIVMALNVLNPLAYFGTSSHNNEMQPLFVFQDSFKVAVVFAIGIAGLVIATFGWKRMEI